MPRNNSKTRKAERRRKAVDRLRVHASEPCSRHDKEHHELMLAEAKRIEEIR